MQSSQDKRELGIQAPCWNLGDNSFLLRVFIAQRPAFSDTFAGSCNHWFTAVMQIG